MADKYKSKYGTVINISGLSPEQTAKIKAMADNKYGSKAAALADQYRKKSNVVKTPGSPVAQGSIINDKTGAINSGAFLGNINYDPDFAKKQAQTAESAAYQSMVRDFERNKMRDMEAAKTELDMRGIPISADSESLWGKTTGGITENYDKKYQEAGNQAILQGAQTAGVYGGLDLSAKDTFMKGVLGAGAQNTNVYGINKDYDIKKAQIKAAAKKSAANTGTADTGVIIGGVAQGFGV